jgi:hypothetical protein
MEFFLWFTADHGESWMPLMRNELLLYLATIMGTARVIFVGKFRVWSWDESAPLYFDPANAWERN